jgi:hypothetical protein
LIQDVIGLALLLVLAVGIWQAVVRIEKKQDAAAERDVRLVEQVQQAIKERAIERASENDAHRIGEADY